MSARDWDWVHKALCAGSDPSYWTGNGFGKAYAQQVCSRCPVQRECEASAPTWLEGIWGGKGLKARKAARRDAASTVQDARESAEAEGDAA